MAGPDADQRRPRRDERGIDRRVPAAALAVSVAVAWLLAAAAIAAARTPPASAAKASGAPATVVRFTATPFMLPPRGGTVRLVGKVRHATTCRLSATVPVMRLLATKRCSGGRVVLTVTVRRNTGTSPRAFAFLLAARGATGTAKSAVEVTEAARPTVVPAITTQPVSQTVSAGATVSFGAAAAGSPAPAVQWQVSTDAGAAWAAVSGATSTTYTFTASSAQSDDRFRAVFTNAAGSATTAPATLTVLPQANPAWAGYIDTGATFTAVTASWIVPTATCAAGETSSAAVWVGIDGSNSATSSTVEQDGTTARCVSGSPNYFAWYEMFGDPAVNGGSAVTIPEPLSAGDSITATVSVAASQWTLTVTDHTANWSYSPGPIADTAPQERSAEWVLERSTPATLTNFGSVTFTGASAAGGGKSGPISAHPSIATQITDGGGVLAAVGPLDPTGSSFAVTWTAPGS